jgi:hypothetical protein
MASPIAWGRGLAGTGVATATLYPAYFGTDVIWLNSDGGSDANTGLLPELPLATVGAAVTAASAGAAIAIAATHVETLAAAVNIAKAGLHFVGFGTGTARPTFTTASGATAAFTVSAGGDGTMFENLYFKAAAATSGAGGRITSADTGTQIIDCAFDCGASDQECVLLNAGADNARIEGCTFTATATRPTRAIGFGAAISDAHIINTTIDGATFGWAGNAFTVNSAIRLYMRNLTLAGMSDLTGTAVASYRIVGVTTSGASKVSIA